MCLRVSGISERSNPRGREQRVDADGAYILDSSWAHGRCAGQVDHARRRPQGIIITIILGIVGAVVGGYLLRLVGLGGGGGFVASIVAGIVGAVILLAICRLIVSQRV